MRALIVIVMVAGLTIPAWALLPSPYIGASLQINSPTGKFSETDIQDKEGGAETGVGGEIDLGIEAASGELYAGYRFGQHNAKVTEENGTPRESDWKLNRFVLGARWHILGGLPITPTLGGGLTLGKTELNLAGYPQQESSNKTGWFLELGGALDIPGVPVSAIADIQYHRFDAQFDAPYNGTVNIQFFTFMLGLRYAFLPV